MADTSGAGIVPPNIILTPQQQSLLLAALNSNRPEQVAIQAQAANKASAPAQPSYGVSNGISPNAFKSSTMSNQSVDFGDASYLDNLDYDFGDSSFDFTLNPEESLDHIPAGSESPENDTSDKRSHPDDEEEEDGVSPKRRDSSEKVPKKPGRKPLTSEPTSKRKAQNRAAQRAFRERKEKHLKDLETKVEELEKASQDVNHENSKLKAQIEQMTSELNQYKQQMTLMTGNKAAPSRRPQAFGGAAINNLNDVNFQFEFPRFGNLPGPGSQKQQSTQANSQQGRQTQSPQRYGSETRSPQMQQTMTDAQFKEELAKFSGGMFTPSMASSGASASRASLDSGAYSVGAATSSPSSTSASNMGPSSSCGTSPEPTQQSPMVSKPLDTLTTIGEEQPALSMADQNANDSLEFSTNGFDWLTQQNGGQFDPQLFGGYREPQDNILANPGFDDFFNDALDADFFTPYNVAPSPMTTKKNNLIDEIDAQKNDDSFAAMPNKNMNCTQLWEKLQTCPQAQTGEFDLDGLCSELTKKAKCSGNGPVVGEMDFDTIMKKYMGKEVTSSCVADKLGVELQRDSNSPAQQQQQPQSFMR